MQSHEFYTIINTAIIGGLVILGLIWIAECRAYERGRLRRMADDAWVRRRQEQLHASSIIP